MVFLWVPFGGVELSFGVRESEAGIRVLWLWVCGIARGFSC